MGSHIIGLVSDIPPGERKIVTVEGRTIGVFNVNGTFYAIKNSCPHRGAPLCLGKVSGTTLPSPPGEFKYGLEGEIIRCPWHGWEFNITDGKSIFDPKKTYVKTYEVQVELGDLPSVETYPIHLESGNLVVYVS